MMSFRGSVLEIFRGEKKALKMKSEAQDDNGIPKSLAMFGFETPFPHTKNLTLSGKI